MDRENYKWFYQSDFLNQDLHDRLLQYINENPNFGITINVDGAVVKTESNLIENRFNDNSVCKTILSDPVLEFIELVENKLIQNGCKVPTIYNFGILFDPYPRPGVKAYKWHKDYNVIEHIQDPNKLWFTIFSLSDKEVNSEFTVSPTPEGPDFWNMGVRTAVATNKLFGHNMNLGHEYDPKDKNNVAILYIRWFDAS